jgi:hypothetical protein
VKQGVVMMVFAGRSLTLLIAVAGVATPVLANDQGAVQAPAFQVGDSWVFDDTVEKGTAGFGQQRVDLVIERLDESTMLVGLKPDGSPVAFEDHVLGPDWSQRRLVDGEETVTTRPFSFPMTVGQTWSVDYVDPTRRGNQVSDHVRRHYKVVGWADVTVPAGVFHALKVEARGVDEAVIQAPTTAVVGAAVSGGGTTSITHTQRGGQAVLTRVTYAEFYYVPKLKNFVKSVEEQYNNDNVRVIRQTRVLVSYKPAT